MDKDTLNLKKKRIIYLVIALIAAVACCRFIIHASADNRHVTHEKRSVAIEKPITAEKPAPEQPTKPAEKAEERTNSSTAHTAKEEPSVITGTKAKKPEKKAKKAEKDQNDQNGLKVQEAEQPEKKPVAVDDPEPEAEDEVTDAKSVKVIASCEDKEYGLDDEIVFETNVTNTGEKTIDVVVTDISGTHELTLNKGNAYNIVSYVFVSEDDILSGKVVNEVTARCGDETEYAVAEAKTEAVREELAISEELSAPKNGTEYEPTEEITVTVTVSNVGNQTQRYPHIHSDAAGYEWVLQSIAPGETKVLKAVFIKDPNAGRYYDGSGDEDEPEELAPPVAESTSSPADDEEVISKEGSSEEPKAEEPEAEAEEPEVSEPEVEQPKAEEPEAKEAEVEEPKVEKPEDPEPEAEEVQEESEEE